MTAGYYIRKLRKYVNELEEEIKANGVLHFLACFPGHARELQEIGCEKILSTEFSRGIWNKLLTYGEEAALNYFNNEEKEFWIRCQAIEPLHPSCEEKMLMDIRLRIEETFENYHIKELRTLLNKINEEGEKDKILCKDLDFLSNVYIARHFLHDFEIAMETINDLVISDFFGREEKE